MKFHKNKFLTTVSAIALVLAVGACSSSNDDEMALTMNGDGDATNGDGDATNGDGDATNGDGDAKTPAETLADARDALMALPADATDEAEEMAQELVDEALRLPGNEAELIASLDAKVAQAGERQSVLDLTEQERQTNADELQNAEAALASAAAEDKEAAQAAVDEALQMPGNEAALIASLDALIASLETQVDDQAQAKKDADVATAAKEASDKAAEVLKALDPMGPATTGTIPSVSASSGGVLTAKAAGYTMSTTTPEAISGFRGAILTKDRAEARVYTNIEDSVATLMDGIYSATSDPGKPKTYTVTDATGTNNVPWMKVTRADTVETVTGPDDARVTSFAGSVSGLAGMFTCSDAACMAPTRNANGSVPNGGEDWTFAPTDPNGKIDVADKDGYLQFGWWLNMKGKDVDDGFNVQTFASADDGYGDFVAVEGTSTDVTGSATYTGGAAGKWAIASTTEDSTEGGHFTATATLGVDFDAHLGAADDVVINKNGVSVSGMITDFMTGDVSRPDWTVTLTYDATPDEVGVAASQGVQTSTSLMPTIPVDSAAATTKWETGGAVDGTGTWEAEFHGIEKDTGHPMAVDGTFHAEIAGGAVGRIQGAFGATK